MKRSHFVGALVAVLAACLLVPLAGSAAGPPDVICPQNVNLFTGTAHDLIVPANGYCQVTGATITHDLILQAEAGADVSQTSIGHDVTFADFAGAGISDTTIGHDVLAAGEDSGADFSHVTIGHDLLATGVESGANLSGTTVVHDVKLLGAEGGTHMELTTIGHDFVASKPQSIQTGRNGPNSPGGAVSVGHDFTIDGSPDLPFVFDGLCNLHVARDLSITNRTVNLGIGVGRNCLSNGKPPDTIGRDLIVTGNTAVVGVFGPSSIGVADNQVGRDLVFTGNRAVPGGELNVSNNDVGRDATCAANDPAVTVGTPNTAGGSNTCG